MTEAGVEKDTLPDAVVGVCASCGAVCVLPPSVDPDDVAFCEPCLDHSRPDAPWEMYFTLGGGD